MKLKYIAGIVRRAQVSIPSGKQQIGMIDFRVIPESGCFVGEIEIKMKPGIYSKSELREMIDTLEEINYVHYGDDT